MPDTIINKGETVPVYAQASAGRAGTVTLSAPKFELWTYANPAVAVVTQTDAVIDTNQGRAVGAHYLLATAALAAGWYKAVFHLTVTGDQDQIQRVLIVVVRVRIRAVPV